MPADVPLLLVDGHNLLWRGGFGFPTSIYSRDKTRDPTAQFVFFACSAWPSVRNCPPHRRWSSIRAIPDVQRGLDAYGIYSGLYRRKPRWGSRGGMLPNSSNHRSPSSCPSGMP